MSDTVQNLKNELHTVKHTSYVDTLGEPTQETADGKKLFFAYHSDNAIRNPVLPSYEAERKNHGVNLWEMRNRNDDMGVWARSIIDVMSVFHKSSDKDWTEQKALEEQYRFIGERVDPSSITDEDVKRRLSTEWIQKWSEMTDEFGAPPEDMLNNPLYVENLSPETYAYLGATYNTIHKKGFGGEWERNVNHTDETRANEIDLTTGVKDYETYLRDQKRIDARYKLADDRSYVGGVASVVEGMWKPIVDNPVPAIGGATLYALGAMTGVSEVATIGGIVAMAGTQGVNAGQLAQAEILDKVYQEKPQADKEDVIKNTWGSWFAVTALNTADPIMTFKLAGLGKITGNAVNFAKGRIVADAVNSKAVNALEKTTGKKIKPRLEEVAGAVLKNYGIDTTAEVAQEGVEGAITSIGIDSFTNKSASDMFDNAYQSFLDNSKEAIIPSMIIGGAIHTPHALAQMHNLHRDYRDLKANVDGRVADELLSSSDLAQRDKATSEQVADEALQHSKVFIDVDRAKTELANNGLSVADYGKEFQELLDQDYHGERLAIAESKFAHLPQNVRDTLASVTSNKDGKPTPEYVREKLSDEKVKELQQEFIDNQRQVVERENKRVAIKQQIDNDIRNNSNIKRKQQSFVANVASSFLSAMSEVTGLDINELYTQFKPTYQMVDELDLSKHKKDINKTGITGTFNNKTNVIQLKPNSDFNTVFHETAHWYLNVMRGLSKTNSQIAVGFSQLAEWSGYTKGIENMTDAEFNEMSEKFVAGFTLSLLSKDKSKPKGVFDSFKRFLFSLKNQSLFSNMKENEDKEKHIRQGFELTYGTPLPQLNDSFLNVINGMFTADVLNEIQEMDYPKDNLLKTIDSVPDFNGLKESLKEELHTALEQVDGEIESATNIISIKEALIRSIKDEDMGKVLRDMISKIPEKLTNKTKIKAYLERVLKSVEGFKAEAERLQQKLEATPLHKYLATVKDTKINPYGLDENTVKVLSEKGYISEDGLLAKDLCALKQPKFVEDYINHSQQSRTQAFVNFLVKQPTSKEQAQQLAMNKTIREFAYDMAKSVSNLEKASALTHKSIAEAVLKALHKALGFKDSVKKVKAEIEQIAEIDVGNSRYKDTKARSILGNASRENKKVQEALAKGDLNGAVSHTRNEYFLNHKAEYASQMKLYVDKKLSDFKTFVARSDKSLSKGYDVDLVDLMRVALHKIGVIDKNPHVDPSEKLERLLARYPEQKEIIKAIVEQLNSNTLSSDFNDLTYNQLNNTIDMLNAMKGLSHDTRIAYIGKEKKDRSEVVDEVSKQLDEHKDKQKTLTTKDGGLASARKDTLGSKVGKIWREFSHSFTLVENLCQQIDKATNGTFHKWIYQVGKDAEVNYKLAKEQYTKRVGEALRKIKKISAQPIEAYELKRKDGKNGEHWTIGEGKYQGKSTLELMGMILHMGTNLEKFLDGYIADNPNIPQNKQAQLEYKKKQWDKFFNRMIDEGHITKEMLDACQVIWDCNEEIGEQVNEASRRVRGFPFKKLPSRKVVVTINKKEYTYTAGYMPAMRNSDIELPHVDNNEGIYEQFNNLGNEMPMSNPSFLEDRTQATYALELDPILLVSKMNDTLRYAHVMPAVVQIKKVLDDPKVRAKLEVKYPDVYDQVLMPWLKSLATMQSAVPSGRIGKMISAMVRGSAMQIMIGNINNALQQFGNISTLLLRTSPAEVIRCLPVCFNSELKAQILKESDFMRVRINEMNDGINELFSELIIDGRAYESATLNAKAKAKKLQHFTNKNAYLAQKLTQNVIDYVGYMSAKNTALKQGKSEEEAIRYAEATVRNCLGSFDLADVASIQRNNAYVKMFTMFGGYFYSMWRLMETEVKNAFAIYGISDYRAYKHATLGILFSIVAPSLIAEVINSIVGKGDWGDDDDDIDLLKSNYFWSPIKMATASFPIIGKLANTGIDHLQGKYFYSSAMLSSPLLTQTTSAWNGALKLINGEEIKGRDLKAMIITAGILSNTSFLGLIARPVSHGFDVYHGDIVPDTIYETVRGYVVGNAPDRIKK